MAAQPLYKQPQDAVWLITGASSGMGQSLSEIIAAHPSHRLVATARDSSKLASLAKTSDRVHTVNLDVTDDESITAAIDSALAKFGRIDVVVNNAGYGLMGDAESALQPSDRAKARKLVETDFWGTANLSLHAIRVFRDENPKTGQQGGVVLNVTSLGGFASFPGSAFYHAAKYAVEGFTESISKEVRPEWNIHFCLIEPGGTRTNFAAGGMEWLSAHPAYSAADNASRLLEGYVKNPDNQKTWTPSARIAQAMYDIVVRAETQPLPVQLPLSAGAWQVVKQEVLAIDKALDEVKEISLGVEVDDANKAGEFLTTTYNK